MKVILVYPKNKILIISGKNSKMKIIMEIILIAMMIILDSPQN